MPRRHLGLLGVVFALLCGCGARDSSADSAPAPAKTEPPPRPNANPPPSEDPSPELSEPATPPPDAFLAQALYAGHRSTCAVDPQGALHCWGRGWSGDQGSSRPRRLEGPSAPRGVSIAGDHACAVDSDQHAWCWGDGLWGQLGTGKREEVEEPTRLPLEDVVAAAVTFQASCFLLESGQVQCAGQSTNGMLGRGETPGSGKTLAPVEGLSDATGLVAGYQFFCALRSGGKVSCWGGGHSGQMGNGEATTGNPSPVEVPKLGSVESLTAGTQHVLALLEGGELRGWGANWYGVLGSEGETLPCKAYGHQRCQLSHASLSGSALSKVRQIASGDQHACAVHHDGSVSCWGLAADGAIGEPDPAACTKLDTQNAQCPTPLELEGLTEVAEVVAGEGHSCARHHDGTVSCWGRNDDGQLGDKTKTSRPTPAPVKR